MGKENIKKEPKDPSVENDRLENKDQKNVNKRPASQNDIGEHDLMKIVRQKSA